MSFSWYLEHGPKTEIRDWLEYESRRMGKWAMEYPCVPWWAVIDFEGWKFPKGMGDKV